MLLGLHVGGITWLKVKVQVGNLFSVSMCAMSRPLRIQMVTPAPARSLHGNRVTALRWARLLRSLGHRVKITTEYEVTPTDLLVALHARRSAHAVAEFAGRHPGKPLIVALTGTDLYHDLPQSQLAQESLRLATRLVILQPDGLRFLTARQQNKTHAIIQSSRKPVRRVPPLKRVMEVAVVAHLRMVKDPFRVALASRQLPSSSKIRVVQIGKALSPAMEERATREMARNARYHWLGQLPRWKTLQRLRRSRLVVVSSRLEGAPNVASEALAADVPMLSSHISGMIGLLGEDYPGYFPVGDTDRLRQLLLQAEQDHDFYRQLQASCRRVQHLVTPRREKRLWKDLLTEIT